MVLFGCFCKETRNLLVQVGVIFFKFTIVIELCRLAVLYFASLPTFNNSSGKSSSRLATKLFYNKVSDLFVVNTADPTMVKKVLDCLQYSTSGVGNVSVRNKILTIFILGRQSRKPIFLTPFPLIYISFHVVPVTCCKTIEWAGNSECVIKLWWLREDYNAPMQGFLSNCAGYLVGIF